MQTLDSNAEVCSAIFSLLFGCRWQKCWDVFSYIKKTSNYPLHPQKCWILSKIGGNESFFWAQHCSGEWEVEGMNPELMKKIVISSLWNSHLKRFFAVSGVLLTSIFITGQLTISTHLIKLVKFVVYVPISTLSSTMSLYVTPLRSFFKRGASKKSPSWLYNIKAIGVKQLTEINN